MSPQDCEHDHLRSVQHSASHKLHAQVSSLGAGKFGWPAVLFNLAGGLLIQKRRAEKALEESSMSYAIVRPGGMERPGEHLNSISSTDLGGVERAERTREAFSMSCAIVRPGGMGAHIYMHTLILVPLHPSPSARDRQQPHQRLALRCGNQVKQQQQLHGGRQAQAEVQQSAPEATQSSCLSSASLEQLLLCGSRSSSAALITAMTLRQQGCMHSCARGGETAAQK